MARAPYSANPRAPPAGRLPGPDATSCRHVVAAAMRGARSRGSGASARGGSPTRGFSNRRAKRKVSSPGRAPAAAAPALLRFLESSASRGARPDGKGGERGGGERRPRALRPRRHEEGAQSPLFPPPGKQGQPAWHHRQQEPVRRSPATRPALALAQRLGLSSHLGGLPLQTLK